MLLNWKSIITAYEKMLPVTINSQESTFSTPELEHKAFCENGPAYTVCMMSVTLASRQYSNAFKSEKY